MPTVEDINWDVLPDVAAPADAAPSTPAKGGKKAEEIDWDVLPDFVPRQPTVLGEFGRAAVAPFKALAKSPKLLLDNEDELYTEIVKYHAQQQSVAPGGVAAKLGQIGGSIVGGIGEFMGAEAVGTAAGAETGPLAPLVGLGAAATAFGATGSWESAMSAGAKALDQGKPKSEVLRIAKQMAGVGGAVSAATALVLPGTVTSAIEKSIVRQGGELIPQTATALSKVLKTAGGGAAVGGGGQLVENLAEANAGLDVSPTEGVFEQALVMGIIPVGLHIKDLYRQARGVAATDPGKASVLQKEADAAATEELDKTGNVIRFESQDAQMGQTIQQNGRTYKVTSVGETTIDGKTTRSVTAIDQNPVVPEAQKPKPKGEKQAKVESVETVPPTPPEAPGGVTTPPKPTPTPPAPQGEAKTGLPEKIEGEFASGGVESDALQQNTRLVERGGSSDSTASNFKPAFAERYPQETLHQIPAWVEPGSALDKALKELRDKKDPFSSKDVTGIWKTLTPEQRQDLAARGWVSTSTRVPGQVALSVSNDSVAARKYYGAQNRLAAKESSPEAKPSVTTEVSPTKAAPEQSGAAIRSFQMQNGRSKVEILPPFEVGGKPQQNFRVNGKTVIGLDELKQEYPLAYEKLIADYPEFKPTTEGDKNAIQPETTQPVRDVQQKPGSKPNEVPPEGGRPPNDERGGEGTAQAPESEAPKKQPVGPPRITANGIEGDWSYETIKALTMQERAALASALRKFTKDERLTDKEGMLEIGSKKISEAAKASLEAKAKEAKPVTEPVTTEIGPTADEISARPVGTTDYKEIAKIPDAELVKLSKAKMGAAGETFSFQRDAIVWGDKNGEAILPELRKLEADTQQKMLDAMRAKDNEKSSAEGMRQTWYKGAIEGAMHDGPTYRDLVQRGDIKPKSKSETKPPVSATKAASDATKGPVGETKPQTPAKAANKAQAGISKVAKAEGVANAKEAKSTLIQEIEKAIEDSKSTDPKKPTWVVIDIPGDGKFKVGNTPEQLQTVLERAEKISTQSTAKRGTVESDPTAKGQRTRKLKPLEVPQDREITAQDVLAAKEQISRFEREVKERGWKDTAELPKKLSGARTFADKESDNLFGAIHEALQTPVTTKTPTIAEGREFLNTRLRQLEALSKAEPEQGMGDKFSIRKKNELDERLKKYGSTPEEQNRNLVETVLRPAIERRTGEKVTVQAASDLSSSERQGLGEDTLGPSAARSTEAFERLFGKKLVFYRETTDRAGDIVEGFSTGKEPNVIFVNADNSNAWLRTSGHELLHHLKGERPDLYDQILKSVRDDMKNPDAAESKYSHYLPGEITEEVIADFVGDQMVEPAFWKRFSENNPTLFQKAAQAVLDWIDRTVEFLKGGDYGSTQFFKDIEKARNVVADAMAKYAESKSGIAKDFEKFSATPTTGRAPIEQYTEALKGVKGEKSPLSERFKEAFDIGSRMSTAKDAFGKALSGLKATGDWIADKFEGVEKIDDLLREKGLLSKSTETRGWQVRQWEKEAKKAVPRARDQAAIRKWVDAGGDEAELRRGMAETKPEYRQAYQDALNLSPDLLKAAQETRKYFEERLDEAIDAGVLEQGVEDYIHRMYESRPEEARKALAYVQSGILKANPAMAKKRVFAMDWEAEKAGFRPVQSFIPAVAEYETSLSRAIAARRFIGKATTMLAPDGRPVVDIKGVGIPIENQEGERTGTLIKPQFNPSKANKPGTPNYRADYVNKEFPALSKWKWVSADSDGKPIFVQGDVAIHPDFVHRINALLEPSQVRYGRYGAVLRPALALGSAFKQTMLDLSMFHQVQIAVHAMEHKVNPFNLVRDIDFQNPNVEGLLKGGVTLGGDYRYNKEGLVGSSLTRQIPILGPALESYHQWLFQDFIPRVKMTMALKAMERNRGRYPGMSEEQIFQKTASQANAAFGELNYVMMERSKTTQDIARLIMLAPDFLEARGRFAAEALSRGGKRFGNEQRTALLLGALTLYTAARALNKATEDQYHFEPENAFSWVHKGQAYSLRTVQGDILHLIDKPLNFWMHRLNPLYSRTLLEAVTQRDSFGRKRSASEMLWDTVSTAIPISLRTSRERTLWESMVNAFGVTDRRWQDTDDAFKMAKKWKADHGVGERGEFIYDPEKDPLRGLKVALSHQDDVGATREIKKLIDSKTYTMPKLDAYMQRYATMPFTGSRANDAKWKAGLSEDEAKTVQAAAEHKKAIQQLYRKAKGQLAQASAGS